ncbi:hypothetical protein DAMNIGENAA_33730 [Desulforhabdus amnigena]|uniref:Aspartate racemase n=1 Tax=Desulforhabdus amnigena TaxID=40218 RepID=A0A9W6LAB3_9BACT|nr:hypothetical protein [Desulforhabdus amnigena]GLI35940.1 hypothetical protein DAMNIGENAA_33730 [Desulforhabdus amnigena]
MLEGKKNSTKPFENSLCATGESQRTGIVSCLSVVPAGREVQKQQPTLQGGGQADFEEWDVIDELIVRGAQGIILGCTEIPMPIGGEDSSVPLFDTTKDRKL